METKKPNNDLKAGNYYTYTDGYGNTRPVGIALYKKGYYLLSNNSDHAGLDVPISSKMGFAFSCLIGTSVKDLRQAIVNNIDNIRLSDKPVAKVTALRMLVADHRKYPTVLGYDVTFNNGSFIFGCGAIEATAKEVETFATLLEYFTDEEIENLESLVTAIRDREGNDALTRLRKQLPTIKNLLKMDAYVATTKKKAKK
jgi:hypothetical protein